MTQDNSTIGRLGMNRRYFLQVTATGLVTATALGAGLVKPARAAGYDKFTWISPRGTLEVLDDYPYWAAKKAGCTIVGLTGRNNAQRVATLDNLARYYHDGKGNPYFKSAFYFTKWTSTDTPPAYVDCGLDGNAASCSTIDYKASTRKHIEDSMGLHIVANFGDQFSDLIGGYSDKVKKLPNPTYYLP